jgi:hypothetical protein
MPKKTGGGDGSSKDDLKFQLSNMRFASVSEYKGKMRVDIREYYLDDKGDKRPGKKGISLSKDEWAKLKDYVEEIDKVVTKGDIIDSSSDSD